MKVELKKLKQNPFRDFKIDPIEPEAVQRLRASIRDHGFWSGVPCRTNEDGDTEIAAGHTRVIAAIEEGITHADLPVSNYNDAEMIRVYADENATQRIDSSIAATGVVASCLKYLIKGVLRNDKDVCEILQTSDKGLEIIRGQIASSKGIGRDTILRFLEGTPGITVTTVQNQISHLKASGDYARIIAEVNEEIAKEQAQEREELARAEQQAKEAKEEAEKKAALAKVQKLGQVKEARDTGKRAVKASSERKPTFDFQGVSKHIKSEHALRKFREVVERESMQKYLPFEKQAVLAKDLVERAKAQNEDLTGTFISNWATMLMMDAVQKAGKINRKTRHELEAEDLLLKWDHLTTQFCNSVRSVHSFGERALHMLEKNPDADFKITPSLRNAVSYVKPVINKLAAKLHVP
jgi:ParB-like chromosome segregation protein Spo0J